MSLDQGFGKEKCSQWLWGQLIRNTGTIGLAFGIDPWMPLEGWGRGVIQYKLSHLLFTLPETICSNLKGTFETPMTPFQLECALCIPSHKCPDLKHPVPQVPCLISLRYSHELQESWRIAACLPKLSSAIPQFQEKGTLQLPQDEEAP